MTVSGSHTCDAGNNYYFVKITENAANLANLANLPWFRDLFANFHFFTQSGCDHEKWPANFDLNHD